jgi:hypothetical protein
MATGATSLEPLALIPDGNSSRPRLQAYHDQRRQSLSFALSTSGTFGNTALNLVSMARGALHDRIGIGKELSDC